MVFGIVGFFDFLFRKLQGFKKLIEVICKVSQEDAKRNCKVSKKDKIFQNQVIFGIVKFLKLTRNFQGF